MPGTGDQPARWVWRGVNLTLAEGESVAVTGPSGTGKTLLLRALAGLDPVDEGAVFLEGRPQADWPAPLYRSRVVYVAQRPALFDGTVEDNLARPFTLAVRQRAHRGRRRWPATGAGHPGARHPGRAAAVGFERQKALDLLAALGRDASFLERPVAALSGGEAQITALVRALLVEPAILLLDEPTASLDEATAREAEALIARWRAAAPGRACLWTSHDRDQLARVADREVALAKPVGEARPWMWATSSSVTEKSPWRRA
ncbi:ABC-type uncharacterized transport system, ATPase component [Thermaerobacter subterraneus DSM 13965]|uniref:ABC-type uncharacterized transport system, ATPase component n=1 Tax=Thermaerobacter subterraneus DSM 13965 TaxID=867903 RepID=K6PMK8_9FIRM|nr:ABC-type uncharacterized transport system, ATPase component [Thermaerobacter subterraneus DSM 13965]